MPMLLLFLGCQLATAPPTESEVPRVDGPPVVALVTIDTWRADFLTEEFAPNVWSLAKQGERYENAFSPMGLTTPAHATMLTGLDPWSHGAQANNHHGYALKPDVAVLPDSFDGWAKAAFVSAYPAGPEGDGMSLMGRSRGRGAAKLPFSGRWIGSLKTVLHYSGSMSMNPTVRMREGERRSESGMARRFSGPTLFWLLS